jgi:hypothetical protein
VEPIIEVRNLFQLVCCVAVIQQQHSYLHIKTFSKEIICLPVDSKLCAINAGGFRTSDDKDVQLTQV